MLHSGRIRARAGATKLAVMGTKATVRGDPPFSLRYEVYAADTSGSVPHSKTDLNLLCWRGTVRNTFMAVHVAKEKSTKAPKTIKTYASGSEPLKTGP